MAAQVGEKFLEKFGEHEHSARIAFRIGQCHYKAEKYGDAGQAFDRFAKRFPDDDLCADSLFWAGESYRMGSDNRMAFRRYNNCRWDSKPKPRHWRITSRPLAGALILPPSREADFSSSIVVPLNPHKICR